MNKTVLCLFPFGKGMGVGHAVRQGVLARELRANNCETILWSSGAFDEIPANLVAEMKESFSAVIRPTAVIDEASQFPSARALDALKNIEGLRAVIVDDYRKTGDPKRRETLRALKSFAHERGAKVVIVDGVRGLEFDEADVIWNMELGQDETLYSPAWKKKMIRGVEYALLRPSTLTPEPITERLPENAFFVMIGGTDPRNAAESILDGMIGTGYNPIILAMKSTKPEDAAKMEGLRAVLGKFPQSAWLANLSAGQICTLWRHAKFAIVGPGSSPCAEAFYNRCPLIGAFTNPSLEENVKALERIGMPTLRAKNHKEFMASWEDKNSTLEAKFSPDDVRAAVNKLEALGYIATRLPDVPPFNQVDGKSAARIVEALGLADQTVTAV